ncbi:hypothetical protein [Solirubrobacter soli]|uniref:hypothetical protein n=1 Tax=Solirubrobacter soli TaxID=363832 RepID=UPI00041382FC|nr:hypothetical protein [Solirubrobacter soli]
MMPRTALVSQHCRERRASHPARRPLAVKSLLGPTLDTADLHGIKESVVSALVLGDHLHIQLVMADLRVKDPKGWVEVDQLLGTLRAFEHVAPQESELAIERNLHRFWAGGPLSSQAWTNLLEMQAVVNESAESATPWRQFLWTTGDCEDRAELAAAGLDVIAIDTHWPALHLERRAARWLAEGDVRHLARLVGLIAVGAYGGVYLDTDIGPGTLCLNNHQLYHADPAGEIGHHAPPFRGPIGYEDVAGDLTLGDSPRERVARYGDARGPEVDSLFASRAGTDAVVHALAERFQEESLSCGRDRFARLFVPTDGGLSRYAPPQQRVTPWAADLSWT